MIAEWQTCLTTLGALTNYVQGCIWIGWPITLVCVGIPMPEPQTFVHYIYDQSDFGWMRLIDGSVWDVNMTHVMKHCEG
jgi:hypothetical protein